MHLHRINVVDTFILAVIQVNAHFKFLLRLYGDNKEKCDNLDWMRRESYSISDAEMA